MYVPIDKVRKLFGDVLDEEYMTILALDYTMEKALEALLAGKSESLKEAAEHVKHSNAPPEVREAYAQVLEAAADGNVQKLEELVTKLLPKSQGHAPYFAMLMSIVITKPRIRFPDLLEQLYSALLEGDKHMARILAQNIQRYLHSENAAEAFLAADALTAYTIYSEEEPSTDFDTIYLRNRVKLAQALRQG